MKYITGILGIFVGLIFYHSYEYFEGEVFILNVSSEARCVRLPQNGSLLEVPSRGFLKMGMYGLVEGGFTEVDCRDGSELGEFGYYTPNMSEYLFIVVGDTVRESI